MRMDFIVLYRVYVDVYEPSSEGLQEIEYMP